MSIDEIIFNAKLLGYDVRITYDDYDYHKVLIQDLNDIENICKSLENRDDTFEVEYKKKYELEDGSFLYSKKEHISIDNPNIPKRELLLRKFNDISQCISMATDVRDGHIKKCYDILSKLVKLNKSEDNS